MRYQALLFDLGGVVLDIDFGRVFDRLCRFSRLPAGELARRFSHDAAYAAHERGELSAREYFDHLRAVLELDASDAEVAAGWNALFVGTIDDTLALVARARERLPCYAFTNTNTTHQRAWSRRYPRLLDAFSHVFVSSELGLRKPEHAAFEHVVGAIGVAPASVLFFDDHAPNVDGARAAGLHAVQVRSPADVAAALRDGGVLEAGVPRD